MAESSALTRINYRTRTGERTRQVAMTRVFLGGATGGGTGGAAAWGGIGGTLTDQADLATALAMKMDASAFSGGLVGIAIVTELPDPQVPGWLYVRKGGP